MAGWFRGKDVRKTPLRVTPKQAVVTMLRRAARRRPLDQQRLDALAPPSSELVFMGRRKGAARSRKGRTGKGRRRGRH